MAQSILERMRSDWNDRASEDAYYFVAFSRRLQNDREFFQTADEVLAWIRHEMRRLPGPPHDCTALEIGCGPARLIRPLSESFHQIYGVDVSDRMIEIARRNLAGIGNAQVSVNSGADLSAFADESIDFVYSYAVFQHIPSREVVLQYLREAVRVLKTNGLLTCQINGLPQESKEFSTWDGARVPASMVVALAREIDCQILALDGIDSQYMWTTWRKRAKDWRRLRPAGGSRCEIVEVRSPAGSGRIPADRAGHVSLTIRGVDPDWDVSELSASVGGHAATVRLIDPPSPEAVGDLRIFTPAIAECRDAQLELSWRKKRICDPSRVEVSRLAGTGPTLKLLTDGINILSGRNVVSRIVKILLDGVSMPDRLRVAVDGRSAACSRPSSIDQQNGRYGFNARLPGAIGPGSHRIDVYEGSALVATERITVGILQAPDAFRHTAPGEMLLERMQGGGWFVITPGGAVEGAAIEPFAAADSRLPFGDGQFAGIVYRADLAKADWRELRRVLKAEGTVYVETPHARMGIEVEIGAKLAMPCYWKRDLGRPLGSRRPIDTTRRLTIAGCALSVWRRLLIGVDRMLGTRLARGGAGYAFGERAGSADVRARLNNCIRCGDVASSDQLESTGSPVRRYGFAVYFCPSCGAPNILTRDS
jgi:SAM-dependent methyltransferase